MNFIPPPTKKLKKDLIKKGTERDEDPVMLENENFYPPKIITLSLTTNSNLLTFS